MTGKTGAGSDELGRHLTALVAAHELLGQRFDEASGSARRIARALRRLGDESGRVKLSQAASRLIEAQASDLSARLDLLIAQLKVEIEDVSAPRGTVLLVEDDPLPAKLLGHALAQEGWEVAIAGTAAQAEEILEAQHVSAIVLDLVLPDADGRNLLLRFKEDPRSSATPVYVASARSDPHVRAECLALGAEDFLQKPVDPQQILEALAHRPTELPETETRPGREKHGRIVDRAALARAFETGSTSNRFLALIAARGPGTAAEDAPERLGAAFVLCAGDNATTARWNADHLAVLIHEDEMAAACRVIEETQRNISEPGQPDIVLSAGVAAVEPETTLEEAIHEAGQLLYLAQTSPGTRIVCDPQEVATPGIRILVAEDDEVAAKLLVYRLTREPGFEVTHCSDGTGTLKMASERRFDLVILDVNMPGLNGFDVLGRLRETAEYSNVPIVMLTALGSEKDVVRGFELGASDYVVKPFSPVELIARVRRLLGGAVGVT